MSQLVDLWGNEETPFATAKERYGVWPTTVWPCDLSDKHTQELKKFVGDDGAERAEVFTKRADDKSVYRGKVTTSVFNPAVAVWALNCWAEPKCTVFDPFAGGGTRALVAAGLGYRYLGVELRGNERAAVAERARRLGFAERVVVHTGDARNASAFFGDNAADFLLTCPPYWNLERYGGGAADLSEAPTLAAFTRGIEEVAAECARVVRPGAFSFWVVGLMRDASGALLPLNHLVAGAHEDAGWELREEIVLHQQNNGAMQRVGQFDKGQRHLVRLHEYGLLFRNPA